MVRFLPERSFRSSSPVHHPVRCLALFCLALCVGKCDRVVAQEAGDTVVPRQSEELRLGDRVIDRVTPSDRLRVESTTTDWLWVISPQGTSGWIARNAVQRVTDASARPGRSPDLTRTLFLTGWLSVAHAHLLHEHLGLLALRVGAVGEDVAESIDSRARALVRHCDEVLSHLETLVAEPLPPDDRAGIRSLLEVYAALRAEASALSRLTKNATAETTQTFRDARQSAEKLLVALGADQEATTSEGSPP